MRNEATRTIPRFREFEPGSTPRLTSPVTDEQRRAWKTVPERRDRDADVVVAGGGLSGVATAIAAARRGMRVVVVEPTHMLGGQATAAGVSAFDVTFHYDHALNDYGIWGEVVRRTIAIYDDELERPVNVGHYRNVSLTPNVVVVERVLGEMLAEAGVEVLRSTAIVGALRDGAKVVAVVTGAGTVTAPVVVDATEDGIVLALAGVPHRISNGVSNGTTVWGITSPTKAIQDITWTATIRAYPEGLPEELRVPEPPPGYEEARERFVRGYPPAGKSDPKKRKPGPVGFAGFRAAPDLASGNMQIGADYEAVTRTNLNHENDFPVAADYLTDPSARLEYEAAAKLLTISIIYYLQTELGLPWSVVTDEGYADGPEPPRNPLVPEVYAPIERHMPLIPYIRESRRLIGTATLTGKAISREPNRREAVWRTDSVAVGTYHPDLHGRRYHEDFEASLDESLADKPNKWREGPFPIPLGCLVPAFVDGFVAAEKNISTSRLAAGAARVHPTVTAIGEAAGVLAALAVHNGVQPREVPVAAVQLELARGGALVTALSVDGVEPEDPRFAAVTLAVARRRVPCRVRRTPGQEPFIVVDLDAAAEAGGYSIKHLQPWFRWTSGGAPAGSRTLPDANEVVGG
ncbi:FAD-dependent oxidoreductase [Actinotalea sp. AC32]|nr:FAD-dependent oxidoreductase [Actinotalea sp. AC32]